MAQKKKDPISDPTSNIKVTMPSKISSSLSEAFSGRPINPVVELQGENSHLSWYDLETLKDSVLELFNITMNQFHETVQLILAAGGVSRVAEYDRTVATACNDLDRYSSELAVIIAEHANRNGIIDNAADHALYMSIFEKYQSFASYFQSALHHVMISMTDFALEADAKRNAAAAAAQPQQGAENA